MVRLVLDEGKTVGAAARDLDVTETAAAPAGSAGNATLHSNRYAE